MSDVNFAVPEQLHDLHDIVVDNVDSCGWRATFAREGTLKVLCEGEVVTLPALAAFTSHLPRSCDVLLGVPGLDSHSWRERRLPSKGAAPATDMLC
jgi:hypothetical protein